MRVMVIAGNYDRPSYVLVNGQRTYNGNCSGWRNLMSSLRISKLCLKNSNCSDVTIITVGHFCAVVCSVLFIKKISSSVCAYGDRWLLDNFFNMVYYFKF